MKTNISIPKSTLLVVILMLIVLISHAQEISNYKDYVKSEGATELVSLATELQSSVYLNDGKLNKYGESPALTLYSDASSIPMLYNENENYREVKLITINILSPEDETALIDLTRLSSFTNLKYILFVYQYDSCGGNIDTCLENKTKEKITSAIAGNTQIFYLLSIPE